MLLNPQTDLELITTRANQQLVICYCAAWCRTCDGYQPALKQLSNDFTDWDFIWIDIEEFPDLLVDDDIENFPTLLIQDGSGVRFLGTLMPYPEHLEKILLNASNLPVLDVEPLDFKTG